MGPQKS